MKITCTDYILSNDTFVFTKEVVTVIDQTVTTKIEITGTQLFDLGSKALCNCTAEQIAIYGIYHRHLEDGPEDMLNKSVTFD